MQMKGERIVAFIISVKIFVSSYMPKLRGPFSSLRRKFSFLHPSYHVKKKCYLRVFAKLPMFHDNEKPYAEREILIENAVFQMLTESIEDS